jgi:glutathionyl-hydroquinone reductase
MEYPSLWRFTRDIYSGPGIADTVNFQHIKHHYYDSHRAINPSGVVPMGPVLDFRSPGEAKEIASSVA